MIVNQYGFKLNHTKNLKKEVKQLVTDVLVV
jgi:hypothetical protein